MTIRSRKVRVKASFGHGELVKAHTSPLQQHPFPPTEMTLAFGLGRINCNGRTYHGWPPDWVLTRVDLLFVTSDLRLPRDPQSLRGQSDVTTHAGLCQYPGRPQAKVVTMSSTKLAFRDKISKILHTCNRRGICGVQIKLINSSIAEVKT